jgi:hypothetical protein
MESNILGEQIFKIKLLCSTTILLLDIYGKELKGTKRYLTILIAAYLQYPKGRNNSSVHQ